MLINDLQAVVKRLQKTKKDGQILEKRGRRIRKS